MTLSDRIRADLALALKGRQPVRANALRLLLASFKNAEIEKREALTEEDCLVQVRKAVKIRREAIEGAVKAARNDVKEKEEAELEILLAYLPARLSDAELGDLVDGAIKETGAGGPADMGKVMKALMPRIAGRAEGSEVSKLVRARLSPRG